MRVSICSVVALVALTGAAGACDCPFPSDPARRQAIKARVIAEAPFLFEGTVLSTRVIRRKNLVPVVEARIKVDKIIRGNAPSVLTVHTLGGDNGANCGFGSFIGKGSRGTYRPGPAWDDQDKKIGRLWLDMCGQAPLSW